LKGKDIRDLTLTFVGSRHPRDILAHLEKERRYTVEEKWSGIYIISGDIMPIQVIDNREISDEENIWLKSLDNRLGRQGLERINAEAGKQGKAARIKAYIDVIARANKESLQEVMMSGSALTLEKIFRDTGFLAKWEAEGEARGIAVGEARGIAVGEAKGEARGEARGLAMGEERKAAEIAKNLIRYGFSQEKTAELSGLSLEKIKALSN
jgi:hypothetical protein